ncbi:hypothetical protein OG589_05515 [Sphaerisporangium sp. NBC_01403]
MVHPGRPPRAVTRGRTGVRVSAICRATATDPATGGEPAAP